MSRWSDLFGSLARLKGGQGNMETNEPEYKSNSGDVKMVCFIFTREMFGVVPREM